MSEAHRPKLLSLELGRFLAASLVVLTHLIPFTGQSAAPGVKLFGGWNAPGALGVDFFFVLSGFVIFNAHRQDFGCLAALPKFWWRRACRIYPAYWLALAIPVFYLYGALTPGSALRLFSLWPQDTREFVAPAWSLRFEITFYLMFSLCLLPGIGRPILAIWVMAALWRWMPGGVLAALHLPAPVLLNRPGILAWTDKATAFFDYYFFTGLAAAWLFGRLRPSRRAGIAIATVAAALLMRALSSIGWGDSYGSPMFILWSAALMAALLLGLAAAEPAAPRFARLARLAGAVSYPLYILHTPLQLLASQLLPRLSLRAPGLYVLFTAQLLAVYGVATLVALWFDQPLQRWLRRLPSRFAARHPVEAPAGSVSV